MATSNHRIRVWAVVVAVAAALMFSASSSVAQNSHRETERRLAELRDLIREDEENLTRTKREKSASQQEYDRISREIVLREELVETYKKRQEEMLVMQDSLKASLNFIEEDLHRLRTEYRVRATHAYKYGRQHDLALILAAESINEMLVRVRYLKRFANQRRRKLTGIKAAADLLNEQRIKLETNYQQASEMIEGARVEQQQLERLRNERRVIVDRLRREERDLERTIDERRQAVRELENRINSSIAASRSAAAGRSGRSTRALPDLTGEFVQNKGRLPWPTIGVVREPFGETVHPVLGTTTPNPGILIATSPSAEVKSVFSGRVISVDVLPEFGTYVIVAHGDYHTVYGNFSLLYVGLNEEVNAGQLIGRSGTEAEPKGEGLFFAVFKDGQGIDPMPWLGVP